MKVFVISHKIFPELNDDTYEVLSVGGAVLDAERKYSADDKGDNISNKNDRYCELTGLYWVWKNCTDDVVGIVHYRRYFSGVLKNKSHGQSDLLSSNEMSHLMEKFEVVVGDKEVFGSKTVFHQYCTDHYMKDIFLAREVIDELYPGYVNAFDQVMRGYSISLFNMIVAKKKIFDQYCDWLFKILFSIEARINTDDYSPYQKRVFGFLAERLLNVWLLHNSATLAIGYQPVIFVGEKNSKKNRDSILYELRRHIENFKVSFGRIFLGLFY